MNHLIRIMVDRLAGQGMEISTIPDFIKNLANTIAANPRMSLQELDRRMRLLGWKNFELDDYTLRLILVSLDSDFV